VVYHLAGALHGGRAEKTHLRGPVWRDSINAASGQVRDGVLLPRALCRASRRTTSRTSESLQPRLPPTSPLCGLEHEERAELRVPCSRCMGPENPRTVLVRPWCWGTSKTQKAERRPHPRDRPRQKTSKTETPKTGDPARPIPRREGLAL
jgi:hypothetical protein